MLPGFKLYFAVGGNGEAATRGLSRRENTAAGRAGSGVTTSIGRPWETRCVRAHTHSHTHTHTQAPTQACRRGHTQPRASHGNCSFAGSLPPSHQSGHLINVTQHHVLLHSVPAGSPKPASIVNFCSSGNYQKL